MSFFSTEERNKEASKNISCQNESNKLKRLSFCWTPPHLLVYDEFVILSIPGELMY